MDTYETNCMAVKQEIKSQLAKLLATEDLVVEHRYVETAQFNVHTRVLTLPQWDEASNVVYDMLVGHEVGHALFTPDEDPPKNIPHTYVNIVEYARIEKLMKRKYMGLAKSFYGGYKELSEQDFFCLENEDISKMNLADRANLWFKIGNHIDIQFAAEEQEIIDMISECETFGDVVVAAEELYKFCKKEKEEKVDDIEMPSQQQGGGSDIQQQQPQVESQTSGGGGEQSEQSQSEPKQSEEQPSDTGSSDDEPEVRTVSKLEEKLKELASMMGVDNIYLELPKLNLETVIAKNSDVHRVITNNFKYQEKRFEENNPNITPNLFLNVDSKYREFKKSAQKEVNYLVKEFECKKAADSYARATTARTGVLDTSKLHTYKYNEDLFKKVSVIPDGKDHGLVFILDWSGSMSHVLLDTIKQLYNLIWFCKKVNIPFDVYAFTGEWNRPTFDYDKNQYVPANLRPHYEKKEGLLRVSDEFTLMNIFTSKTSVRELEEQMINIWRVAKYYSSSWGTGYIIVDQLSLSGTPLNETLVALHQILPKFQKENKLQKVQCIILTDGEANYLARHVEINPNNPDKKPYIGNRRLVPETTFIRDRKLGTTYRVGYVWHEFTDILLENLKDNFPQVNFIGIRVITSRDANSFIRLHTSGKDQDRVQSDWKKFKTFCIKSSGYDAYFGLSSTALAQDAEFNVAEDATKTQIKSAFVKSLKTKKLNKKVLGEFVELIA